MSIFKPVLNEPINIETKFCTDCEFCDGDQFLPCCLHELELQYNTIDNATGKVLKNNWCSIIRAVNHRKCGKEGKLFMKRIKR